MTIVDISEAAKSFPALVERAEAGEEILIAREGRPMVQLLLRQIESSDPKPRLGNGLAAKMGISPDLDVPVDPASRRQELAGIFRGEPWLDIDLDAPLDAEVARAFGMLEGLTLVTRDALVASDPVAILLA